MLRCHRSAGLSDWAVSKRRAGLVAGIAWLVVLSATTTFAQDEEDFSFQIFVGNSDGSDMQRLVELDEYQSQGSPDWSDDGKLIAFDAWKPQKGERYFNGHVFVVDANGENVRDLGPGNTPSFSPQGHRIAYSSAGPDRGIYVMDVDNPDSKALISPAGWGTDWSPNGTEIAYANGDNLFICNWIEGTVRPVFDETKPRFMQVLWNFNWSSDGRQIAFKAVTRDNKPVLAIVDARGEEFGLKILLEADIQPALAWHPNLKQIVVTMNDPDRVDFPRLFSVDVEHPGTAKLLPNLPDDRKLGDPAFSPDGKKLAVLAFKRTPRPEK